jgi:hypothetical protein
MKWTANRFIILLKDFIPPVFVKAIRYIRQKITSRPPAFFNEAWQYLLPIEFDFNDEIINHIKRVGFEISNICNYTHLHKECPTSCYKDKINLKKDIVYKVVDELGDIDFDGIIKFHRYNEPMLNKELLYEYIDYVNKKLPNAGIIIYTNGSMLSQEEMKILEQFNIYKIVVSSYSINEHKRLASIKTNIPMNVFFSKLDNRKSIYTREPLNLKIPCYATITDINVNCYGQLSICCLDWDNKYVFGDLNKQTLREILNSESFLKVHKSLIHGERILGICRRCDWQMGGFSIYGKRFNT